MKTVIAFTALVGTGGAVMAACGGRSLEVPGADGGGGGASGNTNANNNANNNNNNNNNNNTSVSTTRTATTTSTTTTTTTTGTVNTMVTGTSTTGFQTNGFTASTATVTTTTGGPTGTTGMLPTGAGGATSAVTLTGFSAISTTGIPLESTGECDAPYNLGSWLGTITSATRGYSEFIGDCGGSGPEVWFVWQAPQSGLYSINTFGSEFDTVLYQLSQPNCAGRGVVQCNDDTEASADSQLYLQAQAGEFVTFVVDSYNEGTGRYQLQINLEEPTPDMCSDPLAELSGLGTPLVNQQVPFTDQTLNDFSADQCNGGPPRLVYGWTAPVTGRFQFDTFGSNYDTVLTLRADCTDTRGALCNDDAIDLQSRLTVQLQQGTHIRIEVAAFGGNVSTDGGVPQVVLNVQQTDL